ncbi:F-type H+-transporting ATPase subunit b [Maritalea mobilis]|uniref:ATP synthase subunit b n=1 Tax=Maritalea mobilis TaxID=483324 RepID=A0A4R6VNX5_9HYPH|nr:F0F1 ATP synthase subunit B [Maritalea mobilis]TDQ63942.1 F-type H+-transporting ATPase subunit b [Maritalea mobilis]
MASSTNTSDGTHATTEAYGGDHGGSGVFPPFDSSTFGSQILWLALTFAALYILMSKVALPRIGEILEVRRDRIEGDLAEAERLKQKTDQAIRSYEAELADAKQKAHNIAEETRDQIRADLDEKRAKVEADLAKKMAVAENNIRETKQAAMDHVDEIASETALAIVTNIVGRTAQKAAKDAVAKVVKG